MYASVFNPLLAGKPHWHTRKCEAFLTYLSAKNLRRAGWLAMRTPPPFLGAGGRCRPPETGFEDVVLRPLISCGAVTAPLLAAGQPSQPHARTGRLQGCWPVAFRFVFPNRAGDRCLSSGWVPTWGYAPRKRRLRLPDSLKTRLRCAVSPQNPWAPRCRVGILLN
jgi:hypothetical protein